MTRTALESSFPAVAVSAFAEKEAHRKEVNRPATHTHKWWAQRLGTVFRAIVVAAALPSDDDALTAYSDATRLKDITLLDPFAGSGTTLVEALKLGARVIGCDINPVATLVQRQALAEWDLLALDDAYREVEATVREQIDRFHRNKAGETVLYYFWVAQARCPECPTYSDPVPLFSSCLFARHAYPKKHPVARAVCPACLALHTVDTSAITDLECQCGWVGALDSGPVQGRKMTCPRGHETAVVSNLGGQPPAKLMFAKLVLGADGAKRYEPVDDFDVALYEEAQRELARCRHELLLPQGALDEGYNTRQAVSWGYCRWEQFFNDRQLLSLGLLGAAIRDLEDSPEREALAALFSGVLEFNNLFCSYKGEGTGAVRHMFSHHVLKPERVPLEAHPWGTEASSGSFMNLYKSRLIRAMAYKQEPHDLTDDGRVTGLSQPLHATVATSYPEFLASEESVLLFSQSSSDLPIPDDCVDLVVTDPPYFDNVHYSELADFFHAWLRGLEPYRGYPTDRSTTRHDNEVQSTDADEFARAIQAVWVECARVLRADGLLAFTFHQAREDGWSALMEALRSAGLIITWLVPVKAEMSVGAPKSGAKNPSNLDSIVVCRKSENGVRPDIESVIETLASLREAGVAVGWSDVQSVIRGCVLARYTDPEYTDGLEALAELARATADEACDRLSVRSDGA